MAGAAAVAARAAVLATLAAAAEAPARTADARAIDNFDGTHNNHTVGWWGPAAVVGGSGSSGAHYLFLMGG